MQITSVKLRAAVSPVLTVMFARWPLLLLAGLGWAQAQTRRNVVEEVKRENEEDNVLSYSLMVVFSLLLLGYGIHATYRKWMEQRDTKATDIDL